MRQDVTLSDFTKGELSPRMKGRTDYKGYFSALASQRNMVTQPSGGATRCPGTMFAGLAKDQTDAMFQVIELPFVFGSVSSDTPVPQAYQLEFGQGYIRVNKDDAPVVNIQAVTGAANRGDGTIRLQIASTAGMSSGNTTTVSGVTGTVEANGTWPIGVVDATHIDLGGSAFVHAYAGGGSTETTVEIPVPYQTADLPAIGYCQSQDTLYLDHPKHPPATLTRSSHTNWTYAPTQYVDGPYLGASLNGDTLTFSANSGPGVTCTASAATSINGGQGFLATDVGRSGRAGDGAGAWGWFVITGFTDNLNVTVTVEGAVNLGAGGTIPLLATAQWRLGKWSATTGYPWMPMFWEQRLAHLGTNNQISAVELSVAADFTNFAPSATGGDQVVPSNALSWIISDDEVNAMRGVAPAGSAATMQLGIFTAAGEYLLQPATTTQALSATNVQVYRETSYGNAPHVRPLRIGKEVLLVDPSGRQVHAWQWQWAANGYLGPNRTLDAEHITRPQPVNGVVPQGIVMWVYQQNPYGIIWAVLGDGQLIYCTYLPEQQELGAWAHRDLGGNYYGGPPICESVCVVPSPDGTYSELSLVVLRTVNGVPTRTKEVMTRFFDGMPKEQAWFVDCGAQSALPTPNATLTPPVLANSATLTDQAPAFGVPGDPAIEFAASANVFAAGDVGIGNGGNYLRINGGIFEVTQYIDAQHVKAVCWQPMRNYKPATAGNWSYAPQETKFSGLTWLAGETVEINGDGADLGQAVVSNDGTGTAAIGNGESASVAIIGLPTNYVLIGMPFVPESAVGAISQGRAKRDATLWIRFHESLGCNFGVRTTDDMTDVELDNLEAIETRSAADLMGGSPALYSGIQRLKNPGGYDFEQQVEISGDGTMPLTVLSIIASADVGEMEQTEAS